MHTGLVGVAEFDEKPLGLERDEFGHARLDRPDRYFVHPRGEPFTLVGKDSGLLMLLALAQSRGASCCAAQMVWQNWSSKAPMVVTRS